MPYHLYPKATLLLLCLFFGALSDTLLTIAEAESIAVLNAFAVKIASESQNSVKWQYWNALGGYLPSVRFSSQYLRLAENYFTSPAGIFPGGSSPGGPFPGLSKALQQPAPAPLDTGAIPRNLFIHELSVNQAILNTSAFIGVKISSAAQEAQRYQTEAARQEVILAVDEAYYKAVAARARLGSALLSLQFSRENLQNIRIRQESGVVPVTDSLRWEAQIADNSVSLVQAEAAVELSKIDLLSVMGYNLDSAKIHIDLEPFEKFADQCSSSVVISDTTMGVEQNPSWKAVEKSTDVAKLQSTLALTRYFPVLSGFYSYQWQAYDRFLPDNGGIWYLGLSLSVPLFTGFSNTSSYLQQRAETRRSIIESRQAYNKYISLVMSSLLTWKSSLKQVQAAVQRRNLMEKTLSIMDIRYRSGVANQTDLFQVALETEQARVAFVQAVSDCLIAGARYKQSTGNLEVSGD